MGNDLVWKECFDEEKPFESELDQIYAGTMTTTPSDNSKCYIKCVADKGGYFVDGKFVDAKIKELYSSAPNHDALWSAYEGCKNLKGANDCGTVFQIWLCIAKATTK